MQVQPMQQAQPIQQTSQQIAHPNISVNKGNLFSILLILSISLVGAAIFLGELPGLIGDPDFIDYDDDADGLEEYQGDSASHADLKEFTQSLSNIIVGAAGLLFVFALFKEGIGNIMLSNGVRIAMIAGACYIFSHYLGYSFAIL